MNTSLIRFKVFWRGLTLAVMWTSVSIIYAQPIVLQVDARDATRKVLHARLTIPASPGPLTLIYPKWIPGEHGPSGPINELVGLKFNAAGKPLAWRRESEEMFAFGLEVPAGAKAVEVVLDFLIPSGNGSFSSGASATARLVDLSWNQVLLYPKGPKASDLQYVATLRLPEGWKFGTALPVAKVSSPGIEFKPVSLERLVDSPVIAGAHFRTIDLSPGATPAHWLHIVGDSEAALNIKAEDIAHFTHLVTESGALFGTRHYGSYHFLLTLSDHVEHFGLEHHESSDNREDERFLTDEEDRKLGADLLAHELTHSWNGKYRRPTGLATPDFHRPMASELLWVYEGLTEYLGGVLAARSGLWTNPDYREHIAAQAAALDRRTGRAWRPLADTTSAAQILYLARGDGEPARRGTDFYPEGALIWLEADVIIRQETKGSRSLDDFCRKFHGGASGSPRVETYNYDDVVTALNEIAPYDWRHFFDARVYAVTPRAPLGGIIGSGWWLGYTNVMPEFLKAREALRKLTDLSYSLGLTVKEDGMITEVIPGAPAAQAGIADGMKLVAVNGRRWAAESLHTAIRAAVTNTVTIELLVENDDFFATHRLDYYEGEKYPILERDASKPDLLAEILKPLTPAPTVVKEEK